MKKIKILFRIRSLEMGGVNKVLIDILQHLPKDLLDISVMVNLDQGELRDQLPKDITLITIAKGKQDFSSNGLINKLQLGLRFLKLKVLSNIPALLQNYYYKVPYDIEVAFGRSELEMVLKSPQRSSKKIAWIHWDLTHQPELHQSEYVIQQLQQFDHVVFCSNTIKNKAQALFKVEFPNASVIENVIHPKEIIAKSKDHKDLPSYSKDSFTFSSVGRVKNGKGYPLLLNIHKKLIDQGLQHRIVIAGSGDKLDELRSKAKALGLSDSFVLLGNQNNPFPYIVDSDCFILPSQSEAYPLSIKEALILGIPVLATDVGGVNEIVRDNENGWLMTYDEQDITNKMQRIMTDDHLYKSLKEGASNASKHFEIEEIYSKIISLFLNLNH